ncbi:MAG: IS110 family transposase [Pseudomonadota bacterium]
MGQYAGLDVSLKEISICVVDGEGAVVQRSTVATDPEAVARCFADKGLRPDRIVHESGQLSIWLHRQLEKLGLPIICIDARLAHKALSAKLNKSDKADAEGLAQLARTGWYSEVHIRSEASDQLHLLLNARERLVRLRKDLEAHVRGAMKAYGLRMCSISQARQRADFRERLAEAVGDDPFLGVLADTFIPLHETLCAATVDLDAELKTIAQKSPLARRLMTVPGVGKMVALGFIATVDRAERFCRCADIGAFLRLTPRRYQSGETDWSGRISKCGSAPMRALLFEAASCLIRQVKRFSPLKSWAVRLAGRKGFKKAAVATARKIAVILLTIWKDGTEFEWTKDAAT